jgi:hypothetical protein
MGMRGEANQRPGPETTAVVVLVEDDPGTYNYAFNLQAPTAMLISSLIACAISFTHPGDG